jgi:hypothetical protein
MKDPAFLFYPADFLAGVSDLTPEERGHYITMLCLQHVKGNLTEKTIRLSVGLVSDDVMKKFKKDSDGNYYNERLSIEIEKRVKFTESRRKNGKLGGRPSEKNNLKETTSLDNNNLVVNSSLNYEEPIYNLPINRNINRNIDLIEEENESENDSFDPFLPASKWIEFLNDKDGNNQVNELHLRITRMNLNPKIEIDKFYEYAALSGAKTKEKLIEYCFNWIRKQLEIQKQKAIKPLYNGQKEEVKTMDFNALKEKHRLKMEAEDERIRLNKLS